VAEHAADTAAAVDLVAAAMQVAAVATAAAADTGKTGLRSLPQIAAELPSKARLFQQTGFAFVTKRFFPFSAPLSTSPSQLTS
jgi:hypothetical protein